MSIDVSQFHAVFFEESSEHLQEMERLLLALNVSAPDQEELNSIFRAAHSIKGGSGIFGFDALTGLTHVMENLLDRARKHTLTLNADLVDLLLSATDVLGSMLEAYKTAEPLPEAQSQACIEALESALGNAESSTATSDVKPNATEDNHSELEEKALEGEEFEFGFFDDVAAPSLKDDAQEGVDFGLFENTPELETKRAKQAAPVATKTVAKPQDAASIRVDTTKVDSLVNLVGELVITQSMLSLVSHEVEGQLGERMQMAINELQRNTREIQESVMSMRMLPVNMTFNRFPRVVRDLSKKLGKKVELVIEGGGTEIDKSLIEKLVDPLTHLVRNSIDHGIEMPEQRLAAGKPAHGTVTLSAEQKGGNIIIGITDDGAGLSRDKILEKAQQNGMFVTSEMTDKDVWMLIFEAGFSTASEVTDVSGRGVGMDVVRRNIESIGGRVDIESSAGKGSGFYIQLPLTLAILDGMCVKVGSQIFVIPLLNVIESIQPTHCQLKLLGNDSVLWIREQYWPLVPLHQMMEVDDGLADATKGIVVLLESSKKRYGLLVDSILGQQQVVIKSLERHYRKIPGIAGATIMGDGKVAMIIDADSIAEHCQQTVSEESCL